MNSSHIAALEEESVTYGSKPGIERHVWFVDGAHEQGWQSIYPSPHPKSPPPPCESEEDCLEELLLDLAIARESLWILETALNEATNPCTPSPPPPPYSSVDGRTSWSGRISIIELQMDLLIAKQRIHVVKPDLRQCNRTPSAPELM
ncbi:hypothetical protein B0H14DRAFT_2559471 [Mycena olivaceomarginata]|nr:hypothetical protein B0H14DRAFT_2559471 [Mycena olivaceomarginata]